MQHARSIPLEVHILTWHAQIFLRKNRWLIHIVPKTIEITSPFKRLRLHGRFPETLSILIQEVNPDGLTRPALARERVTLFVADEDVGVVCGGGDVDVAGFGLVEAELQVQASAVDVV